MTSRNTDHIAITAHDLPPGLRTFQNRDSQFSGADDLRIVVVHGGSADDYTGPFNVSPLCSCTTRIPAASGAPSSRFSRGRCPTR